MAAGITRLTIMPKSHYDYNVYTPTLISELRALVANVPRAEGVKKLMKRLDVSDRNGRRVYAKYIEVRPALVDAAIRVAKKSTEGLERAVTFAETLFDIAATNQKAAPPAGRPIRRLFLDLETAPNVALIWKTGYKLTVTPESIVKERAIIMAAYKWQDDKRATVLTWDKDQDDKALLAALIPIIAQADEIVFHNGSRFDLPWVRTRALFHGLPPVPDVRECDTLRWARSKFYFNSNKLDYIAKYLGIGGKLKTEFGLWKEVVLNRCPKALARMSEYCANDVILLQSVWARLFDLIAPKTHVGVLGGSDKWVCPRTGSEDVSVSKTRVSAAGTVTYQMRNRATGSYYSISSTAHAAYLEAKGRA